MTSTVMNKTHHTERKRKKVSDHRPDFLMKILIEVRETFWELLVSSKHFQFSNFVYNFLQRTEYF